MNDEGLESAVVEEIVRDCLAVRIRVLNRVITGLYDEGLRPLGVKVTQVNILVAAAHAGLATPGDICKRLKMDASTLSRNVERMRAKGWLETVPAADARAQPFRLTEKGLDLLKQVVPGWRAVQRTVMEWIGPDGVRFLHERADPFLLGKRM